MPPPSRLLLGSGPSIVPERVLSALGAPTIGHLDPAFVKVMEEIAERLRTTWGTANPATLPLSATGSGGMDAMVANLVEPGDRIVVALAGLFGRRMADALGRQGAEVVPVESEWGRAVPPEQLIEAAGDRFDAIFVVHGETSTGVLQPLDGLGAHCREHDALFLIDCVTSFTGAPLALDDALVDAAFSGTQKCLNCPPGLAPASFGPRALDRVRARTTPVRSWYFDLDLLLGYWREDDQPRAYHHTAPINMAYGLLEALRIVGDEGLEPRIARHARAHAALHSALTVLGCERLAPEAEALPPLLGVRPPAGADEGAIRGRLLSEHGIEISGGLGPLAGAFWRIGVMGAGAEPGPQSQLVEALAAELDRDPSDALDALETGWSGS